ncbi:MAG: hypothetical protein JJE17_04760 [Peptostreptococcaceae bacterium]|nr:hypothetical protein [Peptostreptococcaceae bacterium]
MAKSKNIKGYFFKVQKLSQGTEELASGSDLLELLEYIGTLSLLERRHEMENEERTIILPCDSNRVEGVVIPEYEGFLSGMLLRKRDVNLPMTGIEDGDTLNLKPVDLGGGSLMEVTYFMVHKSTGILLFLVNRAAGSYVNLAHNLSSFLENSRQNGFKMRTGNSFAEYLYLANILNMDRLERVEELFAVKSLDFRLVGDPTEIRELLPGSTGDKINDLLGIADYFDAFNISVVLKPKRGGKLSKNKIRPWFTKAKPILDMNDKSKFVVSGTGAGRGTETIDLLNDRFLFTTTIKYEGEFVPAIEVFNAMQLNFTERLTAMIEAPTE